jgi:thiamine kinase-like enzyme
MTTNTGITGDHELQQIIGRVPQWAGHDDIKVSFLSGGITNQNVRLDVAGGGATAGGGGSYVLRLAGDNTDLLGIDRQQEYAAQSAAAKAGIAPEVICLIEPEGYLATRFVNGRSLTPAEMRQPDAIRNIAQILKKVHALPAIPAVFSAFDTVKSYAQTAGKYGGQFPAGFDNWLARMAEIEAVLTAIPSSPAFCHNDLLNGNFLLEDGRVYLLDWEYAGMGDVFFDLANLAAHHEFDDEQERLLLASYFGDANPGAASPAAQARLKVMEIMSDFREAMWGLLQNRISRLDFDFTGYADQHFTRMADNLNRPDYRQWLAEISDWS